MAELSKRLPTEMRSFEETITPPKPAPSFLEALASFGGNAVQAIGQGDAVHRQREAARRAAEEGARKAGERNAENVAARGAVVAMFGTEEENMNAAAEAAKAAAPELLKQQEAIAQGRGLNPAMQRIRSEAVIRQLVAQNPGYEHIILSTLKEYGITSIAMKEYERAETAIDEDLKEERRIEGKYADAAFELGYGDWTNMTAEEKAEVLPIINQYNKSKALFEEADRQQKLRLGSVDIDDKTRKTMEEEEGRLRFQAMNDALGPRFDSFMRSVTQIVMNESLSDAERDEQLSRLTRFATVEFPRQFNQAMALYGTYMTSDQRSQLESNFNRGMGALKELLSGPASLVEQSKRQVELLKNKAGIDVMKAAPFWSYMKSMVGTETLGILLSNQILSDPDVVKRLQNEFKSAIELAPGENRLRLNNILQILKGEETIQSLGDPRKDAPVVLKVMGEMSRSDAITNGTDKQSHADFMRAIENTASVAVEANVGWGFNNLLRISSEFLQPGVIRGMATTTVNREDRTTAINAYQPAVQNLYMSLSRADSGDKYYSLTWDNSKLRWGLKWNGEFAPSDHTPLDHLMGRRPEGIRPTPSKAILDQAKTLNKMIDIQSRLASLGWDPTLPKDVSDRDRRLYYGRQILPESVREERAKTRTQGENVDQLIEGFMQSLNSTPEYQTGDIADQELPNAEAIRAQFQGKNNFDELAPVVEREAAAAGVPLDIAFRLVSAESSWNVNADSGEAFGVMQVTPDTAKLYGVEDVKALNPIQNIKLGFKILKENYEKFGNWADAISAYHSGRALSTAIAAGANDGLTSTAEYVRKIVGL